MHTKQWMYAIVCDNGLILFSALNSDARTFSSRTNSGELVEADGKSA